MKKSLIILVVFFSPGISYGQNSTTGSPVANSQVYSPPIKLDTLNKNDSNNIKTGYWLQLLDAYTFPARKKEQAVFYRYTYYEPTRFFGRNVSISIYPNSYIPPRAYRCIKNGREILKMADTTVKIKKDTIHALNGVYSFYFKNYLIEEDSYKDGFLQYYKIFYKTGELLEYWDYEKKDTLSYSKTIYNKNGTIAEYTYRYRLKGKWYFK